MKIAQRLSALMVVASLALSGCAMQNKSAGEVVDDAVLTAKVKASLYNDPNVKGSEIQVETYKGEVQLSGFVADPSDAQKAVQIARGVQGVSSVKNDIRVK
ncbi:BON domain-containing protein [Pseudoduganella sp. GCM10020061]|uniref:BON domain-containing protein n=1 Tax=Pseudoduganella sp. GCM10020061 TaxID=3317345 RepID=UPI00364376F7